MKRPSIQRRNAYRHPQDPGFMGGYHWRSVGFGLLLLFVANCGATQYVAYHFSYQRALGPPLISFDGWAVYQPFAWAWWLLKYGSADNAATRMGVLSGAMIVVVGAHEGLIA